MAGMRAVGPLFKAAVDGITEMLRKVPRKKRNETLLNIAATKFRKASLQKSLRMKGGLRKWKSQIGNRHTAFANKMKALRFDVKRLKHKANWRMNWIKDHKKKFK